MMKNRMNQLFFVLALSFALSGCEKSAPVETVAPPLVRVYATAPVFEEMLEQKELTHIFLSEPSI